MLIGSDVATIKAGCDRRIAFAVRFLVDHAKAKALDDLGEQRAAWAILDRYVATNGVT
ncbi:MAG TPA: hypothetical protein VIP78_16430 [Candidatus Dormibacteraeota bacterium]